MYFVLRFLQLLLISLVTSPLNKISVTAVVRTCERTIQKCQNINPFTENNICQDECQGQKNLSHLPRCTRSVDKLSEG
ncbi:unnamed protein product, partial [Allacma fusca]